MSAMTTCAPLRRLTTGASVGMLCLLSALIAGCVGGQPAPQSPENICEIFRENRDWYKSAAEARKIWGVPIPVMMAIIYQESRFEANAKPPRRKCLFIFPGPRPSSAFGYAQAVEGTWEKYKRSTGNWGADRDDFHDAIDFIGWYITVLQRQCGIDRKNSYCLYLAYHEGPGGYVRNSHQHKEWLQRVARTVESRAIRYTSQLASCEQEFQEGKGCFLWPF